MAAVLGAGWQRDDGRSESKEDAVEMTKEVPIGRAESLVTATWNLTHPCGGICVSGLKCGSCVERTDPDPEAAGA